MCSAVGPYECVYVWRCRSYVCVCVCGAVGPIFVCVWRCRPCVPADFYLFTTSPILLMFYNFYMTCCVWSLNLCGDEPGTLLEVDQKQLESLKCGAGVGWIRSVGPIV